MYNIENKATIFYVWDGEHMRLIGDEAAFIQFLANGFRYNPWWYSEWDFHPRYSNKYFEQYACCQNDVNYGKCYQFFDGLNRCINPKAYYQQAFALYEQQQNRTIMVLS